MCIKICPFRAVTLRTIGRYVIGFLATLFFIWLLREIAYAEWGNSHIETQVEITTLRQDA